MVDAVDRAGQRAALLAELAEVNMASVRDLAARQAAETDPAVAADLARALHSVSRGVRQTLALEARLEREAKRQEAEAREQARTEQRVHRCTHKARVHAAVERAVWDEVDGDEEVAERLLDLLEARLNEAALRDDFTDIPLETHIRRLCAVLGVPAPADAAEPAYQSSA